MNELRHGLRAAERFTSVTRAASPSPRVDRHTEKTDAPMEHAHTQFRIVANGYTVVFVPLGG